MIRQQQAQIRQMQHASGAGGASGAHGAEHSGAVLIDDSTPTSERSMSFSAFSNNATPVTHPQPRSPAAYNHHRSSFDMSRQPSRRSRTPSRTASPALRPVSATWSSSSVAGGAGGGAGDLGTGGELPWFVGGSGSGRDEAAFYQAETQMLTRENQMLRMRLRELGNENILSCSSNPHLLYFSPHVFLPFPPSPHLLFLLAGCTSSPPFPPPPCQFCCPNAFTKIFLFSFIAS